MRCSLTPDLSHSEERIEEFQHVEWAGDGLLLVQENNVLFLADLQRPDMVERITKTDNNFVFHGLAQGMYNGTH